MKKSSKVFLLLTAASAIVLAASLYLNRDTLQGMARQKQDESIAEEYLKSFRVLVKEDSPGPTEEDVPSENEEGPTGADTPLSTDETENPEIVDDLYYRRDGVTYTPEYAKGTLDCVLEIPSISLKRGVYTGTRWEIEYDLSIWMTTAASPDLKLGETHYAIYGHNHLAQDLSFNRLKDVRIGDSFTLTKEGEMYHYLVSDILAEWRSTGRKRYALDMNQDPSLCYIFTCGRDHWLLDGRSTRYKDYIVVGKLQEKYIASEWADRKNPNPAPEEQTVTFVSRNLLKTILEVTAETDGQGARIKASVTDKGGRLIKEAALSLLNEDGNEVYSWIQKESPEEIPVSEGVWVVAVTGLPEGYEEPPGKEIQVSASVTKIITIGEETEEKAVSNTEALFLISMIAAVLTAVFLTLFVVSIVKRNHGNDLSGNNRAG